MKKLLPFKPDAVFAASDVMAFGAMRAIREAGLRVPEDIAMVGYEDMPAASQVTPALTSIRQPTERMGSLAVDTLIEMIEKPQSHTKHLMLATELVVRSSCS
jgi:LacI family transcriptional regulator